jgi:ATP-dependent DNA ligase
MTDEQRAEVTKLDEMGQVVGMVMEIKHHGKSTTGEKFRHPQFSRWRPDKKPAECTDNGAVVQEGDSVGI